MRGRRLVCSNETVREVSTHSASHLPMRPVIHESVRKSCYMMECLITMAGQKNGGGSMSLTRGMSSTRWDCAGSILSTLGQQLAEIA